MSQPDRWTYRPELDGMRAAGALVIIFFHAQVAGFSASFIVLDMFFVLSGFVVTNVVLAEIDKRGKLGVGNYFARRVRRLLPAAVATILVTSTFFVLVASQPERLPMVRQAQAALVYLANWQFISEDADYFAGDIRESPFMHFWSLSVEEQYYIFFPLLIVLWLRFGRRNPRILLGVVAALMVASTVAQVLHARVDPMRAYFGTDTRLFQLLAGVALAVVMREWAGGRNEKGELWPRAGRALAIAGAAGFVVFGTELVSMSVSNRNLIATLVSAALMIGVYAAPTSLVARSLSTSQMTYLGKISYGIYLWHWPTIVVLERVFEVRPLVIAVLAMPLSIGLAAVSYQFLESPIRRGKWLNPFPWQSVAVGVSISVVAALLLVSPVLESGRTPAVASTQQPALQVERPARARNPRQTNRALRAEVPAGLDFEKIANDRGHNPGTCEPEDPESCVVVDGDGPHVVLVGDSHARMLATSFRNLAREKGFKLSANIVSACPWPHGLVSRAAKPANQDRCQEARQDFYGGTLPEMDADVVVLANAARSNLDWSRSLVTYDREPVRMPRGFHRAVQQTVDLVEEAGARTVILKSIMGTEGWGVGDVDPLDCLARADTLAECVVVPPTDKPLPDSYYDVVTGATRSATTVDLNATVCPDHPVCLPIVDGQVVWRNSDHVAAKYFNAHREEIWESLVGTGFFDQ